MSINVHGQRGSKYFCTISNVKSELQKLYLKFCLYSYSYCLHGGLEFIPNLYFEVSNLEGVVQINAG